MRKKSLLAILLVIAMMATSISVPFAAVGDIAVYSVNDTLATETAINWTPAKIPVDVDYSFAAMSDGLMVKIAVPTDSVSEWNWTAQINFNPNNAIPETQQGLFLSVALRANSASFLSHNHNTNLVNGTAAGTAFTPPQQSVEAVDGKTVYTFLLPTSFFQIQGVSDNFAFDGVNKLGYQLFAVATNGSDTATACGDTEWDPTLNDWTVAGFNFKNLNYLAFHANFDVGGLTTDKNYIKTTQREVGEAMNYSGWTVTNAGIRDMKWQFDNGTVNTITLTGREDVVNAIVLPRKWDSATNLYCGFSFSIPAISETGTHLLKVWGTTASGIEFAIAEETIEIVEPVVEAGGLDEDGYLNLAALSSSRKDFAAHGYPDQKLIMMDAAIGDVSIGSFNLADYDKILISYASDRGYRYKNAADLGEYIILKDANKNPIANVPTTDATVTSEAGSWAGVERIAELDVSGLDVSGDLYISYNVVAPDTILIAKIQFIAAEAPTVEENVSMSFDTIYEIANDGTRVIRGQDGGTAAYLASVNNIVPLDKATAKGFHVRGWMGTTPSDVVRFGYQIDDNDVVFSDAFILAVGAGDPVIAAGGEARYEITADLSGVAVGSHTLKAVAELNNGTTIAFLTLNIDVTGQEPATELETAKQAALTQLETLYNSKYSSLTTDAAKAQAQAAYNSAVAAINAAQSVTETTTAATTAQSTISNIADSPASGDMFTFAVLAMITLLGAVIVIKRKVRV